MKKILQVITSIPAIIFYVGLISLWLNVIFLPENDITVGLGAISGLIMAFPIIKIVFNFFEQERYKDTNFLDSVFSRLN